MKHKIINAMTAAVDQKIATLRDLFTDVQGYKKIQDMTEKMSKNPLGYQTELTEEQHEILSSLVTIGFQKMVEAIPELQD